jgi:uncharacterized cupredoxin-like copper-binding protein
MRFASSAESALMRSLSMVSLVWVAGWACSGPAPLRERVLDIVAVDYAFEAPDTVQPGSAVLRLTNKGSVPHEVIVMKLRPGVTVAQLFAAQQRDESFRPSLEGGVAVLFANPGSTGDGRLVVNFEVGRDYALWCNFQDAEESPPHSAMGMFKQIHVSGPSAPLATTPARKVVVEASDYAFRVADTLPAGVTDFVLTNSGQQRHEVSFARMPVGVSPAVFMDEYLNGNDVDSLYDDDGAVLTAYGGESNEFTVRIDLLAGRSYLLVCELSDAPDAPPHAKMGMFKGIAVR